MKTIYPVSIVTAPTVEPITSAEAQAHLHIEDGDPDLTAIANIYIPAAREFIEQETGRAFITRTVEWAFDQFPDYGCLLVLKMATPLVSIASVKYKDSAGSETTWPSSNFIAGTRSLPGHLAPAYGVQWPVFVPYPVSPIVIRGEVGAAANEIPVRAKQAMLLLVGALFANREAESADRSNMAMLVPQVAGLQALIDKLKVEYPF